MNFKIIQIPEMDAEVCVHRKIGEDETQMVEVTAVIQGRNTDDYLFSESFKFPSKFAAKIFVVGFKKTEAVNFVNDAENVSKIFDSI